MGRRVWLSSINSLARYFGCRTTSSMFIPDETTVVEYTYTSDAFEAPVSSGHPGLQTQHSSRAQVVYLATLKGLNVRKLKARRRVTARNYRK